jgi:hypothetical protein
LIKFEENVFKGLVHQNLKNNDSNLYSLSKFVFYVLLVYLICVLNSNSNSVSKFHYEFNGDLRFSQQSEVVQSNKIKSPNIWKSHQNRSSDNSGSVEKRQPPYYLSYDFGQRNDNRAINFKIKDQFPANISRNFFDETSGQL